MLPGAIPFPEGCSQDYKDCLNDHSYACGFDGGAERMINLMSTVSKLTGQRSTLYNQKRRAQLEINQLQSALQSLNREEIKELDYKDICEKASKITQAVLTQIIKKSKRNCNKPAEQYSKEIREFCLTLHNVSPSGYRYVREALDFSLPHEKTIKRWMSKVDCSPGFNK